MPATEPRVYLRSRGDKELREALLSDPAIKRAVEEAKEEKDAGIRRRLLSTAVRITRDMSPTLDRIVTDCGTTLGVATDVESFVFPSATFNAACVKPESGRVFILLSSSLLEAFEPDELQFVIGHELGHHIFGHHEFPIAELLRSRETANRSNALKIFAWSRYAEISADRAGMVCSSSIEPVARAFFKLASGLSSTKLIEIRAEALMEQLGDIEEELESAKSADAPPREDWFSTHPFSPLRLRAAKIFSESDQMRSGGKSMDTIESEVNELMALMEPNYLEEKTDIAEAMRRLLFSGGVLIAAAEGMTDAEIAVLEGLLGEGRFGGEVKVEAIRADLPRRIRDVRESVPPLRRIQVIRDLCLIALADRPVTDAEQKILYDIAEQVDVDRGLVDRTLQHSTTLD